MEMIPRSTRAQSMDALSSQASIAGYKAVLIGGGIFAEDRLSRQEVEQLVDTFVNQSIDFFSALRSRIYNVTI